MPLIASIEWWVKHQLGAPDSRVVIERMSECNRVSILLIWGDKNEKYDVRFLQSLKKERLNGDLLRSRLEGHLLE
jgi:hypothetical protein